LIIKCVPFVLFVGVLFCAMSGVMVSSLIFFMPRHSKNGGGALGVPLSVCASVRPWSKFGVRSITFERLHRFNSNLVCWYIISNTGRVQFGLQSTNFWQSYGPFIKHSTYKTKYKNWCPLNNFWKTASMQFKFSMLIYNIKTQVEFDLGYNPLIFDRVMGLFKKT